LEAAGIEVLFDDRTESPGIKFKTPTCWHSRYASLSAPALSRKQRRGQMGVPNKEAKILPLAGLTAAIKQMVSEKL